MAPYVIRRLLGTIPVVLVASFVVFMILNWIPGDPATIIAGPNATPESVEAIRVQYGLDEPLLVQYVSWLGQVVQGNFGTSLVSRVPALEVVQQRMPATLQLAFASLLIATVVSIPLGLLAATRQGGKFDTFVSVTSGVALGIPNFWFGLLSILVFALYWGILPPGGYVAFTDDPVEALRHLILPAITLALNQGATLVRFVRASAVEVLATDHVAALPARGLAHRRILYRHVLPNSLVPVLTVLGLQFARLLGGAIVVETIFAWPGVGGLIVSAIGNRDYPVIQCSLLLLVMIFVLVNLVTDVLYGVVDPRIRQGQQ
jgi:peptide/nickel transport system permease protein